MTSKEAPLLASSVHSFIRRIHSFTKYTYISVHLRRKMTATIITAFQKKKLLNGPSADILFRRFKRSASFSSTDFN